MTETNNQNLTPVDIQLLQKSKQLIFTYEDGSKKQINIAKLRANSPSAENKSAAGKKTEADCSDVNIVGMQPVGHYALQFAFDDGHQTGIYSWQLLFELGEG